MTELPPLPDFPALPREFKDRGLWIKWAQEYALIAVASERARAIPLGLAQRVLERLEYPGPSWIENRSAVAAELRAAIDAQEGT